MGMEQKSVRKKIGDKAWEQLEPALKPVSGKWNLAKDDMDYHFSSASFYETGVDDFGFLKNIFTIFDGD